MKTFLNTLLIALTLIFNGCTTQKKKANDNLNILCTTTMITDLVKNVSGNLNTVEGLMGPGVDPHLYKASESDVNRFHHADIIFYNGLHLEGKLVDIFEKMEQTGKHAVPISEGIEQENYIQSENFASNYDPHIWFNIEIWKKAASFVCEEISKADTANKNIYQSNLIAYLHVLDSTNQVIKQRIDELVPEKRILITAHDAFNYFGKEYGFKVMGLQGISTAAEAGVKDVQNLANIIVEQEIKAIFIESSVPRRNVEALQQAVKAKGFEVKIGGELFSDSMGSLGTTEGTYTGMFLHNVNVIVNALK